MGIMGIIKRLLLVAAIAACTTSMAFGQGARRDGVLYNTLGPYMVPQPGGYVRVCSIGWSGQPCTPLASVYSDVGLSIPLTNPIQVDNKGRYSYYVSPGIYEEEYTGSGVAPRQAPNITILSGSSSGGVPCTSIALSLQYNNSGLFGCIPDFTFSSPHTLLVGASGILDAGSASSVKVPCSVTNGILYTISKAINCDNRFTWTASNGTLSGTGGLVLGAGTALGPFSAGPSVTPLVTGSTTYDYTIICRRSNLAEVVSPTTRITNGFATIDSMHTNSVSWTAVSGCDSYDVYSDWPVAGTAFFGPSNTVFVGNTSGTTFVDSGSVSLYPGYPQGAPIRGGWSSGVTPEYGAYLSTLHIGAATTASSWEGFCWGQNATAPPLLVCSVGSESAINGVALTNASGQTAYGATFTAQSGYASSGLQAGAYGTAQRAIGSNASGTLDSVIGGNYVAEVNGAGGTINHLYPANYQIQLTQAAGTVVDAAVLNLYGPLLELTNTLSITKYSALHIYDQVSAAAFSSNPIAAIRVDNQTGVGAYSIITGTGLHFLGDNVTFAKNLLPSVVNTSNIGSSTLPFLGVYIGPAAGNTIAIVGTNLSANRTYQAGDASGTLAPVTGSPSNGDCAKIIVSGGFITSIASAGVGNCSGSSGTTAALSAITAATGQNTIANGDNDQEWQFHMTTNSTYGFQFDETTFSTATSSDLVFIHTLSGSTVKPFKVTAVGTANGVEMGITGIFQAIGSGVLNANQYKGGTAAGTGSCGVGFVIANNDAAVPTCSAVLSTAGDVWYYNGSAIARFAGNTSGTACLVENSSGVPAWQSPCAGGGNVSNVGTPAANQLAQWVSSTTIQGISTVGNGASPAMIDCSSPNIGDYIANNAIGHLACTTPGITANLQTAASYTVDCTSGTGDRGKLIIFNRATAVAVTVPQAGVGACGNNFYFAFKNIGAGAVTFTPTTSTINPTSGGGSGAATIVALSGQQGGFDSNGTDYFVTLSGFATVTSSSIGGAIVGAGCDTGTVTVNGIGTGAHWRATATPNGDPGSGVSWGAYVSGSNTVTVKVCSAVTVTPTSLTYEVTVQ